MRLAARALTAGPRLWVAIAVAIRLAYVLWYPQYPALIGDDDGYNEVAWNIASGAGFAGGVGGRSFGGPLGPEIAIGPGYPAFLAGVYVIAGHDLQAARIAQALAGGLIVLLCYLVGRDAMGEEVGRIAAALSAVTPALVSYTGMLLTETVFTLMLVASVWLVLRALAGRGEPAWMLAGVAVGLAVLVREEALYMMPLAIAASWKRLGARRLRALGVFVVATGVTLSVWTARNYAVFGEFVLVSANAGQTVWLSTVGWEGWRKAEDPTYRAIVGDADYLRASRLLMRQGFRNIAADPIGYLRQCVGRIVPLWIGSHTTYITGLHESFDTYYERGAAGRLAAKLVFLAYHLAMLALAALGLAIAWQQYRDRRDLAGIVLAPIVTVATVHFFLFATSRYLVPVVPFLLVFGAVGLRRLLPAETLPAVSPGLAA